MIISPMMQSIFEKLFDTFVALPHSPRMFLSQCSTTDKSFIFSIMAEANVTYSFDLFLKGYTLTDAGAL